MLGKRVRLASKVTDKHKKKWDVPFPNREGRRLITDAEVKAIKEKIGRSEHTT